MFSQLPKVLLTSFVVCFGSLTFAQESQIEGRERYLSPNGYNVNVDPYWTNSNGLNVEQFLGVIRAIEDEVVNNRGLKEVRLYSTPSYLAYYTPLREQTSGEFGKTYRFGEMEIGANESVLGIGKVNPSYDRNQVNMTIYSVEKGGINNLDQTNYTIYGRRVSVTKGANNVHYLNDLSEGDLKVVSMNLPKGAIVHGYDGSGLFFTVPRGKKYLLYYKTGQKSARRLVTDIPSDSYDPKVDQLVIAEDTEVGPETIGDDLMARARKSYLVTKVRRETLEVPYKNEEVKKEIHLVARTFAGDLELTVPALSNFDVVRASDVSSDSIAAEMTCREAVAISW